MCFLYRNENDFVMFKDDGKYLDQLPNAKAIEIIQFLNEMKPYLAVCLVKNTENKTDDGEAPDKQDSYLIFDYVTFDEPENQTVVGASTGEQ